MLTAEFSKNVNKIMMRRALMQLNLYGREAVTNPRTNPWNFHKNFLRIGDFEKRPFWKSAILDFFFQKKKNFAWFPWKFVTNYVIEWMGLNFDVFPGFQQIPCYA